MFDEYGTSAASNMW